MRGVLALALALCSLLGACGIGDGLAESNRKQQEMLDNIKKTSDSLKKTAEAVHLQVLTVAMEQMLSPENTKILSPPIRMMPYAQTFAKEATPEELIRVSYVLLMDAVESTDSERSRMVSLVGMGCLAALAPAEKVDAVLAAQVDEGGRYRDTAYSFALARYMYVRDFLLAPIIEKSKHLGMGSLRESTTHFRNLKALRALPYRDRLVLDIPSLEIKESLDPEELKAIGEKARKRFQMGLESGALSSQESQELLKMFDV